MANKVFISYKNTINGVKTHDSEMAKELYTALEKQGIPCFFAEKTLEEQGSDKYKERIDLELDQCIILVLVGSSMENINSNWVRYEWDGFCLDILNGCKNGKVFTYVEALNPHELPRALRTVQSFQRGKDSMETILRYIENAISDIEGVRIGTEEDTHAKENKTRIPSAFEFSAGFLHSGATKLKDCSIEEIREELSELSKLYDAIYYVKQYDKRVSSDNIAESIYKIIMDGCMHCGKRKLLKLKGPLGSYKNRLLQYLYLLLEKEDNGILPFYIDLAMYEKSIENHSIDDKKGLEQLVKEHFDQIREIICLSEGQEPLIILDGIRDFSSGHDQLYSIVKANLSKLECKVVVNLDTDFTNNTYHRFSLHPLAGTDYEYFIRISSMNIYDKEGCIQFIRNCLKIFHIKIPCESVDETVIYNRLVNLNVIKIDAYWLSNLLTEMLGNILNEDVSLADLYEAICRKSLDVNGIDSAAKLAYDFEYGSMDFSESDFYFDARWKVLRKHRSVLDYLIARYYIIKLSEINTDDMEDIREKLIYFNMILPKAVTVFVSPMINKIDEYEHKILFIARNCYGQMSMFERNQLVFWMGRLKNKKAVEDSVVLLKEFLTQQSDELLHRTICVSLMSLEDKETAKGYYELLLNDKHANEVNRAFHLTYYGDKTYIPNKTMMDFEDDIKHGNHTFEILCASVQNKIDQHKFNCMLILEVFTLCSLIQARIEGLGLAQKAMDVKLYALRTMRFLKWLQHQRKMMEFEKVRMYFIWMQGELDRYINQENKYYPAEIYNEYSSAKDRKCEEWVRLGVADPESLIEHAYGCWLMAVLYLPDKSENSLYSKEKIQNMLLIRNLAKMKNDHSGQFQEQRNQVFDNESGNMIMNEFLFSGTYPNAQSQAAISGLWDEWYYKKDINYDVVEDIVKIQTVYQFCEYYMKHQELFGEEEIGACYEKLYEIRTDEGQRIAEKVIIQNRKFQEINEKFGENNECF